MKTEQSAPYARTKPRKESTNVLGVVWVLMAVVRLKSALSALRPFTQTKFEQLS